jgi:hypothetical protein
VNKIIVPIYKPDRLFILPELEIENDANLQITAEYLERSAHVWIAKVDDNLICVFGVVTGTLVDDTAYLWFMEAPAFDKYKFVFARHSREVVNMILTRYPVIVGHCVTRSAERWLQWLGATFVDRQSGVSQFEIRAV